MTWTSGFPALPPVLARIGRHLPQWPPTLVLVAALELARRLEILPADALATLHGRRFEVEVLDAGVRCRFEASERGFRPTALPPEVAFRAPAASFIALLTRREDPDTLFFQRRLIIEGDTALGLAAKNLLDAIDWSALAERLPGWARASRFR